MKRVDWFILMVLAAMIVVIILVSITTNSEHDKLGGEEKEKESKLDLLQARLEKLKQQIASEIESLRLTTEMQQFLDRKITRIFTMVKLAFLLGFGGMTYLFIVSGHDYLTALLNTMGVVGFIGLAIPFLFVSKVLDVNAVIEWVRSKIRMWIYRKYGHDPLAVVSLTESVVGKISAADSLGDEIKALKN